MKLSELKLDPKNPYVVMCKDAMPELADAIIEEYGSIRLNILKSMGRDDTIKPELLDQHLLVHHQEFLFFVYGIDAILQEDSAVNKAFRAHASKNLKSSLANIKKTFNPNAKGQEGI